MSVPIKELSVPDLQRFIPVVHSVSDQDPHWIGSVAFGILGNKKIGIKLILLASIKSTNFLKTI